MLCSWLSWLSCVCQASLVLKWASCRPPVQRSPQRRQRHWCVWPARASRQTGAWAGSWTREAGLRRAALGSWRRTVCTAGAAAWLSLSRSGWRASQWAVRSHGAVSLRSLDTWRDSSVQSRSAALLTHVSHGDYSTWAPPSFSTSASAALLCVLHTRLYVCFSIHSVMVLL